MVNGVDGFNDAYPQVVPRWFGMFVPRNEHLLTIISTTTRSITQSVEYKVVMGHMLEKSHPLIHLLARTTSTSTSTSASGRAG
jgi:hypothetical protein